MYHRYGYFKLDFTFLGIIINSINRSFLYHSPPKK
jgi:hypothetical protein